jgi:hypothetical protein
MSAKPSKRNITVQIDEALLKSSRHLAVDENQSLSEWVANLIAAAVKKSSGYAASKLSIFLLIPISWFMPMMLMLATNIR